ncbi:hypothetical protein FHW84_003794 [Dyella sp. SG562]|uniref:hypothetical protein n=1 Tax=Dyella sp. SG562 TaxID=2587017 RepID=UPI001421C621|nr:hypothetical protein [Dyella sp. SG562]NII75196.1 hypothetical protein [Dyella sp. SG562]
MDTERKHIGLRSLVAGLLFVTPPTFAGLADDLGDFVGYTIIASKTIDRWYDPDGKKGDSFEGCEFDRTIVFTDGKVLHCATYRYQYGYYPKAVILSDGRQVKMVVDSQIYDMRL